MTRIAFLVLAHADPVHLGRLSRALASGGDVYIHLDQKAAITDFKKETGSAAVYIPERHSVAWAGISMVDAIIALMRSGLRSTSKYSHFILLTGSDYPIKPLSSLVEHISREPETEFMKYINMTESPEHYMKLIKQRHFQEPLFGNGNNIIDKIARKALTLLKLRNSWPSTMTPYFGHTWCALTANCVQHIVEFHDKNPEFRCANVHTFAPDEHYFHTIVGNSNFSNRATGLQTFEGRGLWRLANLHLIDPSLQKWFTLADWDQIFNSDKFFVRKVSTVSGASLVDRIDMEVLSGRVR